MSTSFDMFSLPFSVFFVLLMASFELALVLTDIFVCPLLSPISALFDIFILTLFAEVSFGNVEVLSKSATKSKGSSGFALGLDVCTLSLVAGRCFSAALLCGSNIGSVVQCFHFSSS